MGVALYEIVGELKRLQDMIEEANGEIPPDVESGLASFGEALSAKIDGVCKVIRNFELDEVVCISEIDRLTIRKRVAANAVVRLKAYLKNNMEALGEQKIKTALFSASVCKNSQPSISVSEGTKIPDEFAKTVTLINLDREKVLEAWKTDPASVPLCIDVNQGTHLRIK